MCHFITATLPQSANIDKAREVFIANKLGFEQIENESIIKRLKAGDYYILTTSGMCDCGTVLGVEFREKGRNASEENRHRSETAEKLMKKGWSQTKIERWFREAELTSQKEKRSEQLAHEFNMSLVSDWINFVRDVITSQATNRIGLLLHWYKGSLNGRIDLKSTKTIPLGQLTEASLLQMEEDRIYEFVSD